MTVKCPNPACGKAISVPDQCASGETLHCAACHQALRVVWRAAKPPAPPAPTPPPSPPPLPQPQALAPSPPPLPQPQALVAHPPSLPPPAHAASPPLPKRAAPRAAEARSQVPSVVCPVCSHKVRTAGKRCQYCGADLSLPPDQQEMVGLDIVRGVSVRVSRRGSKWEFSGTLQVRDDGLQVQGHSTAGGGAFDSNAAGAGLALAAVAIAIATQGAVIPVPGGGGGSADGCRPIETFSIPWDSMESIENPGNCIHVVKVSKKAGLLGTKTIREELDIAPVHTPGSAERCCATLYEQVLRYKQTPSAVPHCPGCRRVLRSDAHRCAYCGATW